MHLIATPQTSTAADLGSSRPAATWTLECTEAGGVWTLSPSAELDARDLARLAEEIGTARASGRDAAVVCSGTAQAVLESVHFHRFVDVFSSVEAAQRWLHLGVVSGRQERAA